MPKTSYSSAVATHDAQKERGHRFDSHCDGQVFFVFFNFIKFLGLAKYGSPNRVRLFKENTILNSTVTLIRQFRVQIPCYRWVLNIRIVRNQWQRIKTTAPSDHSLISHHGGRKLVVNIVRNLWNNRNKKIRTPLLSAIRWIQNCPEVIR